MWASSQWDLIPSGRSKTYQSCPKIDTGRFLMEICREDACHHLISFPASESRVTGNADPATVEVKSGMLMSLQCLLREEQPKA